MTGGPDWRRIELSRFRSSFDYGRGRIATNLWRLVGAPFLRCSPHGVTGGRVLNALRIRMLRLFGARIGKGVVIDPCQVHMPWRLSVGDHSWIGAGVDIYNLAPVEIGANVCVSQKAFLCTGNHDYSDPAFALQVAPIRILDAAWVCASCFIGPGVTLHPGAVALAGSVVLREIPEMTIAGGNPCVVIRKRSITKE